MGERTYLTRTAYVEAVDGNLAWLDKQPRTLEQDHIRMTIIWSVAGLYDVPPAGPHEWFKSAGPNDERCHRCLATRTISAGAAWEYFDAYNRTSSFLEIPCKPPERFRR